MCVLRCGDRPNVESRGRSTTQRLLEPTTVLGPTALSLVVARRCSNGSTTSGGGFGVVALCLLGEGGAGAAERGLLPTCFRVLFCCSRPPRFVGVVFFGSIYGPGMGPCPPRVLHERDKGQYATR